MRTFNLRPLSLAILGISASSAFANTTTETTADPTHQLSTIVVSAAGYEQKIKDAPASITVLTEEDFKTKRITSLADALKGVEGVDISPAAGKTGTLNIRMRGMPSEYTLILIDGKRQNSVGSITPNGFTESNNNFIPPISAIERIEVIRGPMSTLYGSDAMGGVINIITKKVADTWTGSVSLNGTLLPNSSEFGNQYAAEIFTSGPLVQDLLGLQLRGRKAERQQSYITVPGTDGTEQLAQGNSPTKSDIETFGGRLTFTPHPDHTFALDFENTQQWFDNSRGQLGTYLNDNGEVLTPDATQGYGPSQEYERNKGYISHEWQTDFGRLESSISHVETETVGRYLPAGMLSTAEKQSFINRELKSEDTYFDTKFTTQYFANHNITVGGQWWDASQKDGIRRQNPELSFEQYGLFIEDTWSILPNLNLTLGGRFDDHSSFGDFFTPRAYLVWNMNDQWTAKGGYAEGYKVPRLEQLTQGLSNVASQGRSPVLGNINLQPETSENMELGIYFDNLQGFNANVTLFQNKTKDKITTTGADYALVHIRQSDVDKLISNGTYVPGVSYNGRPIGFDCTGNQAACDAQFNEWGIDWTTAANRNLTLARPYNAEEAESHGVEVAASYQVNDQWKVSGNYTWTEGELTDSSGKTIDDTDNAKHVANVLVNYQPASNASLWLRGEYRSSQVREEGNVKNTLGDYKGYTQWHLGTNYSVNDNIDIGVALYNIFDVDFVDYQYVTLEDAYYNRYLNTQEGRRVQLSTTFKF
ncbi:TonB-dependent receptor [Acinetobacter indicus]|uniref:TonB-dependent receptor domain-containing protein n=1 Tax=Acinetobacter indicus TaxID=756892 RepID=UPI002575C98D|nr:TonB-dependent receptor [Acinetobacter indicus]MDM1310167.1 TonB-dependent receptor [Acinetobacter indicus]